MEKPLMLVIRDTYRLWANHMRVIAGEAGVPDSYRMVLTSLLRHPGMSQTELAAHCGITAASTSQTIKEMQRTGYVTKETDAQDQRCVRLCLTEKGLTCAREIRKRLDLADARISALLTQEREDTLRSMMEALTQILERERL